MKTRILLTALSMLGLSACGTEDSESEAGEEYIVVSRTTTPPDQKRFQAIEIHSRKSTPVLSIQETTGRMYQAHMSSLPECNKKVIQGYISQDTIFVTTKVLRDTTVATVGQ